MTTVRSWLKLFLVVLIGAGGCRNGGHHHAASTSGSGITIQHVLDMIAASTAPDSDKDGIPDDVEQYLGTNPNDRDTDHDGVPDLLEVLGNGPIDATTTIPDRNHNGVIAPLDAHDSDPKLNDGMLLDSDGDGISNYLEYYGYTYDWRAGRYLPWNGTDYTVPYFKTDPYQRSTDQDPFDDNVEASGINMDVSVRSPGNKPMVPAYPDIEVQLQGYSVTVNEEITWTQGASLAKGTTWERSMQTEHSYTDENNWETGVTAGMSFKPTELGGSVEFHANYGGSHSSTSSTSYSVAVGSSILSEENWQKATTTNPTDAAHIKLFLKVYNRGTATASAVIPTLTLKIGGHNIATFEPGSSQINLLAPLDVYPEAPGVYWVVDSVDTGANVAPISLTLGELKALESGAPVSISVTQVSASVMEKNPTTGAYQSVGDWNEYMARIRAVCAHVFLDIGDGNVVSSYVYAGDSVTAPIVTLRDALVWVAGAYDDDTGAAEITYRDQDTGQNETTSLANWQFAVDGNTYRANGFSADNPPPDDFDLSGLVLQPGSVVVGKAPRSAVPSAGIGPEIHYAYYDPITESVDVVPSDYDGIASVEFVDKNGVARAMTEDIPGSSFYTYAPNADTDSYPNGYEFDGTEKVRVTNVNGQVSERWFIKVFVPDMPDPPIIDSVDVDINAGIITAHVESEVPLDAEPAFVRAYDAGFASDPTQNDYITLKRVTNAFEDPTGWWAPLPTDIPNPPWTAVAGIRVVAYIQPNVYATYTTTEADSNPSTNGVWGPLVNYFGLGNLTPTLCFSAGDCVNLPTQVTFWGLDLDTNQIVPYAFPTDVAADWTPPDPNVDIWFRPHSSQGYLQIYFSCKSSYIGIDDGTNLSYAQVTPANVTASNPQPTPSQYELQPAGVAMVFGYVTDQGNQGKMRVVWSGRGELNGFEWDQYSLKFATFH